jgi:hypothetical protein
MSATRCKSISGCIRRAGKPGDEGQQQLLPQRVVQHDLVQAHGVECERARE